MESCFPPLTGLSLRSGSSIKNRDKNRHSTGGGGVCNSNGGSNGVNGVGGCGGVPQKKDILPKLEVLQDLDLYYIRQIASSLKVIFRSN